MFTAGWEPPKLTRRSSSYLSGGVFLFVVAVMVAITISHTRFSLKYLILVVYYYISH